MRLYPLHLKLEGKKLVFAGCGKVGSRKLGQLCKTGAKITICDPHMNRERLALVLTDPEVTGRIELRCEAVTGENRESLLRGSFLVIAASDDPSANEETARYCMDRGILVNCATDPSLSDCIMPSVVDRDPVLLSITTGVPALTKYMRKQLERMVPQGISDLAIRLSDKRKKMIEHGAEHTEIKRELNAMIEENMKP